MPMRIVRNDITKMRVDAIVNAANTALQKGGGVCGAIFAAAGAEALQAECDRIGGCGVGKAVRTGGHALPARHILHAVGPIWQGGGKGEAEILRDCYRNALELAREQGCKSVAFPLISTGIYGYPKDLALGVAVSSIGEFLLRHEMLVYLVVYDKASFQLGGKLFASIEEYIDNNYVEEQLQEGLRRKQQVSVYAAASSVGMKRSLEDVLGQLDESFSQMLLRLIDEKGMTDVEAYRKANVDRKLFSKIRNNKSYSPSKGTAIAFAIALELNLDETLDLLGRAGYTLSQSSKFDVIIQYFIEEGNYRIFEVNEALFAFDQPLLGV
ncbi:macro domain-containing protein [Anaerotalea alkaliphila]|uniref:RNase III inhibitor n=1 Tax=Anaerotalea alkaliphila TaxID=2662126 RepID=A0A7X5KN60_9FIRM|nr:macro domain-containing protein [Anaerotalea alkaliphila]NDL67443.1 RNase III inhibitor [Anaerotalea alkaliphila]